MAAPPYNFLAPYESGLDFSLSAFNADSPLMNSLSIETPAPLSENVPALATGNAGPAYYHSSSSSFLLGGDLGAASNYFTGSPCDMFNTSLASWPMLPSAATVGTPAAGVSFPFNLQSQFSGSNLFDTWAPAQAYQAPQATPLFEFGSANDQADIPPLGQSYAQTWSAGMTLPTYSTSGMFNTFPDFTWSDASSSSPSPNSGSSSGHSSLSPSLSPAADQTESSSIHAPTVHDPDYPLLSNYAPSYPASKDEAISIPRLHTVALPALDSSFGSDGSSSICGRKRAHEDDSADEQQVSACPAPLPSRFAGRVKPITGADGAQYVRCRWAGCGALLTRDETSARTHVFAHISAAMREQRAESKSGRQTTPCQWAGCTGRAGGKPLAASNWPGLERHVLTRHMHLGHMCTNAGCNRVLSRLDAMRRHLPNCPFRPEQAEEKVKERRAAKKPRHMSA